MDVKEGASKGARGQAARLEDTDELTLTYQLWCIAACLSM